MRGECGRFPSGAFQSAFHPAIDDPTMISALCKENASKSFSESRRQRLSRWRSAASLPVPMNNSEQIRS
jgi:hypothetical protein